MNQEFNISEIKEKINNVLENEKEIEVLSRRFGIDNRKKETLESIGRVFGVTRERIRQIEKGIFKKLDKASSLSSTFSLIESKVVDNGGIITTLNLENILGLGDSNSKAILRILLESLNNLQIIESPKIKESWVLKKYPLALVSNIIEIAENILKERGKPIKGRELVDLILRKISDSDKELELSDLVKAVLLCAKIIGKTPEGNLGLTKWGIVNPKNTRDKAYIVFKKAKKPLHYKKLTELIREEVFSKKRVSVEAVHNELIRDPRFVLIGRGIYALKEWGYKAGTVADVIEEILKKESQPLHKNEIIKRVLEKRQVKTNTILLNLQEKPQFVRIKRAVYKLREKK